MVVVMQKGAAPAQRERVLAEIVALGFTPHVSDGESRSLIGAIGPAPTEEVRDHLRALPGVENVVRITRPSSSPHASSATTPRASASATS